MAQSHVIGFYNVENLFDTVDDPTINDEEFLPEGANQWTPEKYQIKLNQLAKVIAGMNADIIGLSEIENRKVLEDLVTQPLLAARRFQIVHFDMDDERGVDVALLYRPAVFKPFDIKKFPVRDPSEADFKTRDVLWVKGLFYGDTLHVSVNHWPSRRGSGNEDKRLLAANVVKHTVDSVINRNPEAKIVIMGDFNDDPANRSIRKILLGEDKTGRQALFNTSESTFKRGYGTLGFNGAWNLFDQIIISKPLMTSAVRFNPTSFSIFVRPEMQESAGKYKGFPRRCYVQGVFRPDGYSDHFPVFIVVSKN